MTRLYLDTAPIIYTVEQVAAFAPAVDARLAAPGLLLVVSELTRLECRVQPLRKGDAALLQDYDDFFNGMVAEVVSLTRPVVDRATLIRARYGFKTPDALHLGAAVESGCSVFLTNDHRLRSFTGITVEVV